MSKGQDSQQVEMLDAASLLPPNPLLQPERRGLSWEPEAGRGELGRAALPCNLGTQPGGEVGTGQEREKLGAGGV